MDTLILLLLGVALAGNITGFIFLFIASKDDEQGYATAGYGVNIDDKKAKIKKEQEQYKFQKQQEEMKRKQEEDELRFREQQGIERYRQEQEEIRLQEEREERERQKKEAEEKAYIEEQKRRMLEEEQQRQKQQEEEKEQFNFKRETADNLHERFDMQAKYEMGNDYKKPIEDEEPEEIVVEIKEIADRERAYQFDPSNMMLERNKNKDRKENNEVFKKEEENSSNEEDYSKYFDDYQNETEEEKAKKEVSSIMNNLDDLGRSEEEIEGFRKQHQFTAEERKALEYGDKSLYEIKENKLKQVDVDINVDIDEIHEKYYGKKEKTKRELFETADIEKERPNTVFDEEEEKKKETINIREMEPSKYETNKEPEIEEMNDDEMDKRISFLMEKMNKEQK